MEGQMLCLRLLSNLRRQHVIGALVHHIADLPGCILFGNIIGVREEESFCFHRYRQRTVLVFQGAVGSGLSFKIIGPLDTGFIQKSRYLVYCIPFGHRNKYGFCHA